MDEVKTGGPAATPARLALPCAAGAVMLASFWMLMSTALTSRGATLVHDIEGASYAGPLTLPSRWLGLDGLAGGGATAVYAALVACLALAYAVALYAAMDEEGKGLTVVIYAFFTLFVLVFLFAPLLMSRDVFSYLFHGRAMSVYGANPYLLAPAARPADVLYPVVGWKNNASVYGPLFNLFSLGVAKAAGDSIPAGVLGFKLMSVIFYAGSLPLVFSLAGRLSPERRNMALAACAWSPLLILHFAGGGHNDAVMVFFVLAGFLLYARGRPTWGLLLVVLAVMVKLSAGLALLPYLVLYLRDGKGPLSRRLAWGAGLVVGLPALMYLPFWEGTEIFAGTLRLNGLYSLSSVPRLFAVQLEAFLRRGGMAAGPAEAVSGEVIGALFLMLCASLAVYLLSRVRDFRSMVLATAGLALAWFLTSSYILPWYLALGLLVAVTLGWNLLTGAYLAAATALLLYRAPHLGAERVPGAGPLTANLHLSLPLLAIGIVLLAAWVRSRRRGERPSGEGVRRAPGREVADGC